MKIVLLVEGDTEIALKNKIKSFLDERAELQNRPKVRLQTKDIMGSKPVAEKFQRRILLELKEPDIAGVVGLIDVEYIHPSPTPNRPKNIFA
jgi:hypothetical protein